LNQKQRLQIHERVFHKLYTARLSFNHDKVMRILNLIDAYCYEVNGNNGELSSYEIRKRQDELLSKLGDI
jgi:hypothetical protein